ncbi:MAG: class I SAM-dependent methyltransferase [Phycisphaerales bacterium]
MAPTQKILNTVLRFGQRLKFSITPNHFYSDIPDLAHLERETYWRKPWSMTAIQGTDTKKQLANLTSWCAPLSASLAKAQVHKRACDLNGEVGYGPTEADVLYCFLRANKPRKIVQVGCGVSTAICLIAAEDEPGYKPEIVCVEPYPTPMLTREHAAGRIRLFPQMAQTAPIEELTSLEAGDLFFVDSTHTVKPGSEVLRVIFEVLPRLKPGVFVHFHDIYFPYDYGPATLTTFYFWRETAMLMAFLTGNPSYEIAASLSMLHDSQQPGFRQAVPGYKPRPMRDGLSTGEGHFPSATYLRKIS